MRDRRVRVHPDLLRRCYQQVFEALGVPRSDAEVVADSLCYADLRAIDTHGAARLPVYVDRLEGGGTKPVTRLELLADNGTTVTVDAHDGLGQVAARSAMGLAMKRAEHFGIAATAVRRSNHLGALSFYAEMAVARDMIGFALSGVAPTLAAFGGRNAVLGSNPWSVAVPSAPGVPLVVDMAQGVTISTHLRDAMATGESIPEGWAVGARGRPTTDPAEALAGAILPFGGAKGYALALVLEVLASVLTGAAYSTDIPDYGSGTTNPKRLGHFLFAMRIDSFLDPDEFKRRLGDLLDRVRRSGPPGEIRIPGERGRRAERQRLSEGVPVSASLASRISDLTARLGTFDPFRG